MGIREKLTVTGGSGRISLKDKRGQEIVIDAANSAKMVIQMARDFVIDTRKKSISTSSFAVVHQVSTPFCIHQDTDRYDAAWTGAGARQRLKEFRRQFDTYLYKRYDKELGIEN